MPCVNMRISTLFEKSCGEDGRSYGAQPALLSDRWEELPCVMTRRHVRWRCRIAARCAQREGRKREEGSEDGRQETVGNSVSIRKIHGVSTKNGFFFPDALNLT